MSVLQVRRMRPAEVARATDFKTTVSPPQSCATVREGSCIPSPRPTFIRSTTSESSLKRQRSGVVRLPPLPQPRTPVVDQRPRSSGSERAPFEAALLGSERGAQRSERRRLRRVAGQVARLSGVGLEVEELLQAALGAVRPRRHVVLHRLGPVLGRVLVGGSDQSPPPVVRFDVDGFAPGGIASLDQRPQAAPQTARGTGMPV